MPYFNPAHCSLLTSPCWCFFSSSRSTNHGQQSQWDYHYCHRCLLQHFGGDGDVAMFCTIAFNTGLWLGRCLHGGCFGRLFIYCKWNIVVYWPRKLCNIGFATSSLLGAKYGMGKKLEYFILHAEYFTKALFVRSSGPLSMSVFNSRKLITWTNKIVLLARTTLLHSSKHCRQNIHCPNATPHHSQSHPYRHSIYRHGTHHSGWNNLLLLHLVPMQARRALLASLGPARQMPRPECHHGHCIYVQCCGSLDWLYRWFASGTHHTELANDTAK